jgi:YD repeat-containing protein
MKRLTTMIIPLVLLAAVLSFKSDMKGMQELKDSCILAESSLSFSKKPTEKWTYIYDSQGRLISKRSATEESFTFSYTANEIIEEAEYYDSGKKNKIKFNHKLDDKGRIISSVTPGVSSEYTYNNDGYLAVKKTSNSMTSTTFQITEKFVIIDGDLISRIVIDDEGTDTTFFTPSTYSSPVNFHYFSKRLPFELTYDFNHYYGKALKNLIIEAKRSGLSPVFYTYQKDAKGNIIQATSNTDNEKEKESVSYKYRCD